MKRSEVVELERLQVIRAHKKSALVSLTGFLTAPSSWSCTGFSGDRHIGGNARVAIYRPLGSSGRYWNRLVVCDVWPGADLGERKAAILAADAAGRG